MSALLSKEERVRIAAAYSRHDDDGAIPCLLADIAERERITAADNERLRLAGERVGLPYGCDTAEQMADEIDGLFKETLDHAFIVASLEKKLKERNAEIERLRKGSERLTEALERVKRVSCGEDQLEDEVAADDSEALGYLYRFCCETLAIDAAREAKP